MRVHKIWIRKVLINTLVLIKHALPAIDESIPASAWPLSVEGRRKCKDLSRYFSKYFPAKFYSSKEPKAVETAQLSIPNHLSSEVITDWRLNEHHRETYLFQNQIQYEALVKDFFEFPNKLIFGEETADQAHAL